MRDLNELRRLAEAASPGEWAVWFEYAETDEKLKAALCEQVDYTSEQDRCGGVYMINADGKCPALTGCGPTSKENADFLVGAQPKTVLALLDRLERAEADAASLRRLFAEAGEALEPFAAQAVYYDPDEGDGELPVGDFEPKTRELRTARTVATKIEEALK